MGKVTTLFYGALIVFAALDAMLFGIMPSNILPIAVIILGAMVLFTPITLMGPGRTKIGAPFQWIRQWVFGAVMVIMGIVSTGFVPLLSGSDYTALGYLTLDTLWGQLILLIIGVIYFFAAFKRTRQAVGSF